MQSNIRPVTKIVLFQVSILLNYYFRSTSVLGKSSDGTLESGKSNILVFASPLQRLKQSLKHFFVKMLHPQGLWLAPPLIKSKMQIVCSCICHVLLKRPFGSKSLVSGTVKSSN